MEAQMKKMQEDLASWPTLFSSLVDDVRDSFASMTDKAIKHDEDVDQEIRRLHKRVDRHRSDLDALSQGQEGEAVLVRSLARDLNDLGGQVADMKYSLCHCNSGPSPSASTSSVSLSGDGSSTRPHELQEQASKYQTPPTASSPSVQVAENVDPVPVRDP